MKIRTIFPLMILAGLILIVGLGCSLTSSAPPATLAPTEPPTERPTEPPTQPPIPEAVVSPTQLPVSPATEAPMVSPKYFTEEFNGDISDWWYFVENGDSSLMDLGTDNGSLVFNLTGEDLYVYVMYDPWIYSNTRLDVTADNRGKNSNSVSLVCRYSEDEGWYEFNIGNDGLWQIFVYDITTSGGYQMLNSGGSTAIKSGREINEYTAICNDRTLSLYINGVKATSFEENKYALRDGLVGLGVSSYQALPIIVNVDRVSISEP